MRDFNIITPITVLNRDEMTAPESVLVEAALEATAHSYAPYSRFNVGAAIRLANGVIVTGANQENAAFSSGTCAERSACFYAGSVYKGVPFEAIAIAARGTDGEIVAEPIPPCGACRQALLEYETLAGHDIPLLLVGRNEVYRVQSVKSLLPLSFTEF